MFVVLFPDSTRITADANRKTRIVTTLATTRRPNPNFEKKDLTREGSGQEVGKG
jgi:hypothetical protein